MAGRVMRVCLLLLIGLSLAVSGVHAAPPAGTLIKNQASASYRMPDGVLRSTTSNLVTTLVTQVAGISLDGVPAQVAVPGAKVRLPQLLVNTGNGADEFTLLISPSGEADALQLEAPLLYPDVDQNGVPDQAEPITGTGVLAAGEAFAFVLVATVPREAVPGQEALPRITAGSLFDTRVEASASSRVTVTDAGALALTQSINATSVLPGSGPHRVRLHYANTGIQPITDLNLVQVLPAGLDYVPGSARWSESPSTVLTDGDDGDRQGNAPSTLVFCAYAENCLAAPFTPDALVAVIDSVPAGTDATLEFDVTVNMGVAPQFLELETLYRYFDGMQTSPQQSANRLRLEVLAEPGVDLTGATVAEAVAGARVDFINRIHNQGSGADTFNLIIDQDAHSFPPGTAFVLLGGDAATPVQDSNGDGIADSGPLAPADTRAFVVRALLPLGAPAGEGPFDVPVAAVSVNAPQTNATAVNRLQRILAAQVDLTLGHSAASVECTGTPLPCALGKGPGDEPAQRVDLQPGGVLQLVMYVNNVGAIADSYDMTAAADASFANLLDQGWDVSFSTADGVPVHNSGVLTPAQARAVRVEVRVPADLAAGSYPLYLRTQSPASTAADAVYLEVRVAGTASLRLDPEHAGQILPGASVVYTHTLSNDGNTAIADLDWSLSNSLADQGWNALIYRDTDGDRRLGASDAPLSRIDTIGAGERITLFVKVLAPSQAAAGAVNQTRLSFSYPGGEPLSVGNSTRITGAGASIVKEQALDSDCSGSADGGENGFVRTAVSARPGQCVRFRLTATNTGTEMLYAVVVSDATPAYTRLHGDAHCIAPADCRIQASPAVGATGSVRGGSDTLAAGAVLQVEFGVQVE